MKVSKLQKELFIALSLALTISAIASLSYAQSVDSPLENLKDDGKRTDAIHSLEQQLLDKQSSATRDRATTKRIVTALGKTHVLDAAHALGNFLSFACGDGFDRIDNDVREATANAWVDAAGGTTGTDPFYIFVYGGRQISASLASCRDKTQDQNLFANALTDLRSIEYKIFFKLYYGTQDLEGRQLIIFNFNENLGREDFMVDIFIQALQTERDAGVRKYLIHMLAEGGSEKYYIEYDRTPPVVTQIINTLLYSVVLNSKENTDNRITGALGIANCNNKDSAFTALEIALKKLKTDDKDDQEVRAGLLDAFLKADEERGMSILSPLMGDKDEPMPIRIKAAEVIILNKDGDEHARKEAVNTLWRWNTPESSQELAEIFKKLADSDPFKLYLKNLRGESDQNQPQMGQAALRTVDDLKLIQTSGW